MDFTGIIASLGATTVLGGGLFDLQRRFRGRKTDSRKAVAEAEGLELSNVEALQRLIREPLAAVQADNAQLRQEMEALRAEFRGAKKAWSEERSELRERVSELQHERDQHQRRVGALEQVVEALRAQIRELGKAPAA